MRGRLPENSLHGIQNSSDPSDIYSCTRSPHIATAPVGLSVEEADIHEQFRDVKNELRACSLEPTIAVTPYTISPRERAALMGVARIVQQDMRVLQDGLSRAGRPPHRHDGEYVPAPDWDSEYLSALIDDWNEPVLLESDYYLLRSMCLYDLGISIQVKVLTPDRVRKYLEMAMTLAQKGYQIMRVTLGKDDSAMDKYWRYPTMISCILQIQAMRTINEIKERERIVELAPPDALYEMARQQVTQALRSFECGMRYYPTLCRSTAEPFKDQEWSKMAALTEAYTQLTNEILARQIWTQHTVRLLKGAWRENRKNCAQFVYGISKAHLQFALWIHEQPGKPLLLIPKIIDSLYMMSLVCVSPHLIHSYSRKAAYWIDQLRLKFPNFQIEPSYVHSADLMAAKDKAMQAIVQQRQAQQH
ncbi:hypothetical protein BGZ54_005531 [Gamsiella multidivaricata]|nr:hypothetical protein BGZ54_005531 [Gamsiella multidivaricata]